jgi:hypothetical protein
MLSWAFVLSGCLTLTGCGLTLGPTVQNRVVIVKPGQPIRVLDNRTVKGSTLQDPTVIIEQDVGGGVWMPEEHWQTVSKVLEQCQKK